MILNISGIKQTLWMFLIIIYEFLQTKQLMDEKNESEDESRMKIIFSCS